MFINGLILLGSWVVSNFATPNHIQGKNIGDKQIMFIIQSIKITNMFIQSIMSCSSNLSKIILQTKCIYRWMRDLPHLPLCITAPMASMYKHVNACSWYLKQINKTYTLIWTCEGKRTIKQWNKDSYIQRRVKTETHLCMEIRNKIRKTRL